MSEPYVHDIPSLAEACRGRTGEITVRMTERFWLVLNRLGYQWEIVEAFEDADRLVVIRPEQFAGKLYEVGP